MPASVMVIYSGAWRRISNTIELSKIGAIYDVVCIAQATSNPHIISSFTKHDRNTVKMTARPQTSTIYAQ